MGIPADTIAAIATPLGPGGIGIVRLSGGDLAPYVQAIVGKALAPRTATFATFRDARGAPLDQGIAILFAAPASYTGENVLELHGHGSPAALRLLLARALELGARLAQPGEFTKRAFLNGRIDLAQAEGVADLIEAATTTAARAAARSLCGEFSREVHALVGELTELRMFTEAALDFPDEDIAFVQAADAAGRVAAIERRLDALTARARTGARLGAGLTVVLAGRPNVGKSSLLNRLVREEAAIVTAVAGTTRDTVERQIETGGIPLTVIDTAGLRAAEDEVERIGIERTWAAIARADLALVIIDARDRAKALHAHDQAILDRLPAALPHIVIHNKIDLAGERARTERSPNGAPHVWLSALTGEGVEALEREVLAVAGVQPAGEDAFTARERHLGALRAAHDRLREAARVIAEPAPALELFAEALREAQHELSTITGEFTADDLLGVIFSRFCIGK